MDALAKKHFGFAALRRYQKDVIEALIAGRDCLVVMATGGGKSICYQLPPLLCQKTSIVISPLLSLMQDQVMSLNQKGIRSDYLGSSQSNPLVSNAAEAGQYDVLYMTPEKAMSSPKRFWVNLLKRGICLVAVDEAHCISDWGPDFRIEYKKLNNLRKLVPGVPFVALTATATSSVREDIICSLSLRHPHTYIGSFDRPNLYYGAKQLKGSGRIESFLAETMDIVSRRYSAHESTIIYCSSIRDTEQVYDAFTSNGIPSGMYHGQMDKHSREKSHRGFVTDEFFVMVATIAFGMGIDKPDVRCVIHYGCPKSLESYYQESGRCGRDGSASSCLLYYSRSDFSKAEFYCSDVKSERQKDVIMKSFLAGQRYCCLQTCRRHELLKYFGQASGKQCGNCDNCNESTSQLRDISIDAVLLINCIRECGERWGMNIPISVLRGSNAKKVLENNLHLLSSHGKGKDHLPDWWKSLADILVCEGYIEENLNGSFRVIRVSVKGYEFLSSNQVRHEPLVVKVPREMLDADQGTSDIVDYVETDVPIPCSEIPLSDMELELYERLLEARKRLAHDNDVAPYFPPPLSHKAMIYIALLISLFHRYAICSDQVMRTLAKTRPSTIDSLSEVDGVNQNFINRFGVIIIHCIHDMSVDLNLEPDNIDEVGYSNLEELSSDGNDSPDSARPDFQGVLDVVAAKNGVSFEDIAKSFDTLYRDDVASLVEELQLSFDIFIRDGLFYTL